MDSDNLIKGQAVYLRQLSRGDASYDYLSWMSDADINCFLESRFNPPKSIFEIEKYIDESAKNPDISLMGIFLNGEDRHIGNIKLGPINHHHKTADLGFLIGDKREWGKGLASQAITLISNFGLTKLKLEKITAGCYAENIGSQKSLLKAGFLHEGRLRSHWLCNGIRQDGLLFGKTAKAYE